MGICCSPLRPRANAMQAQSEHLGWPKTTLSHRVGKYQSTAKSCMDRTRHTGSNIRRLGRWKTLHIGLAMLKILSSYSYVISNLSPRNICGYPSTAVFPLCIHFHQRVAGLKTNIRARNNVDFSGEETSVSRTLMYVHGLRWGT